jgi:tRNA threonylcarbamoyladenosine biosynthesis protein TsaE
MRKIITTKNPEGTKKSGETAAKRIRKNCGPGRKQAFVIALEGELGAGKTTFLQGFAKGLGIKEKILSPTFVIMRKFRIMNHELRIKNFFHIDCYRLNNPKELLALGFKEIILDPENIVAIEWADKIKKILPRNVVRIKFKLIEEKIRRITFNVEF